MLHFTIQGIVSPTSPGLTDRTRLGGYKRKQATDGNGYVSNQTGIATIARRMSGCVILSNAVNRNSMVEGVRKSGTEKHDGTTDVLAKARIDVWERLDLPPEDRALAQMSA